MKNKDVKFLLFIVGAILILVILLGVLFNKINGNNQKNDGNVVIDSNVNIFEELPKEDKVKLEKYNVYMENSYFDVLSVDERLALIDFIDEILNAINTKNYNLLYSKLNYIYVDSIFTTQEKFEEYMNSIMYGATDYTCTYYNAEYYGYECLLTSVSQGTEIELQIKQINDFSDYEISFRKDLVEINERLKPFYTNGISGIIEYEFVCKDTLEYSAIIMNNTKKPITCSFGESVAIANFRGSELKYKLITPIENLIIEAGKSENITFVFDIKSTESVRPSYIDISCKVGEKVAVDRIYVDPTEDDIGL